MTTKQFTLDDFDSNYVPQFFRKSFEDSSSFYVQFAEKPIKLGVATWLPKLFQIETGVFPVEINWDSRISDEFNQYYVIVHKSIAKETFYATPNPEVYLVFDINHLNQIYAEKAFLIAYEHVFEIQPIDSIQSLEIEYDNEDDSELEFNHNEYYDSEMQTQFKPKIIKPLPKPIISQHHDSIYSVYCDFMGKLYGQKFSAEDLDSIFANDDRLLYLLGLSLEEILNDQELDILDCLIESQIAMNYFCKSLRLIKLIAKNEWLMNKIIQSDKAMYEVTHAKNAMQYFIQSHFHLRLFGTSDIAIQAIYHSDLAMNLIQNNPSSIGLFTSSKAISKILMRITGLNPKLTHNIDDMVDSAEIMNLISNSEISMNAIMNSEVAVGKYIAKLAGLNPKDYKDIDAIINSEIAIDAIESSDLAMNILFHSEVAVGKYLIKLVHLKTEDFKNMTEITKSEPAMNAIGTSVKAIRVLAKSKTAMNIINQSSLALDILYKHAEKITYQSDSATGDILIGKNLLVRIKCTRGSDYDGNYIKINNDNFMTSENFNTGEGRKYYTYQVIDNQLRLASESVSAYSSCIFEFAYFKLD